MKRYLFLLLSLLLVGCSADNKVAHKDTPAPSKEPDIIHIEKTHDGSYKLDNSDANEKGMNIIFEVAGNRGTLYIQTDKGTETIAVSIVDNEIIKENGSRDVIEWTNTGLIIYEEINLVFTKQ